MTHKSVQVDVNDLLCKVSCSFQSNDLWRTGLGQAHYRSKAD
jgi:hypothetical protein